VNSGVNGAIPSAVLNVVWLGIGLYAMAKRGSSKTDTAQVESPEGRQPPLA